MDEQIFYLSLMVLMGCLILPALVTLFVITFHKEKAPRIKLSDNINSTMKVNFNLKGVEYSFPVQEISRTGLSFTISNKTQLLLEGTLPLEIKWGENLENTLAITSQLIHMRLNQRQYIVGVKFTAPLSNDILFGLIDDNEVEQSFTLLDFTEAKIVKEKNTNPKESKKVIDELKSA